MNNLWTISLIEAGFVAIESSGFTCLADSSQNLERQLACNGFTSEEILEVFLQLSARGTATISVAPVPIHIRPQMNAKITAFSQLPH